MHSGVTQLRRLAHIPSLLSHKLSRRPPTQHLDSIARDDFNNILTSSWLSMLQMFWLAYLSLPISIKGARGGWEQSGRSEMSTHASACSLPKHVFWVGSSPSHIISVSFSSSHVARAVHEAYLEGGWCQVKLWACAQVIQPSTGYIIPMLWTSMHPKEHSVHLSICCSVVWL